MKEDEETFHLFCKENKLEIPDNCNPKLIPYIIHYLYFREIKTLPFAEIENFFDLAIFFHIKDLPQKIIDNLIKQIDTAKKAVFILESLGPLEKKFHSSISDYLADLFLKCRNFLFELEKKEKEKQEEIVF